MIFIIPLLHVSADARELYLEAEGRFRSANYTAALNLYQRLIDDYPISTYVADAQFRKAICLYQTGKGNEALSLFEKVSSRYRSTSYIELVPFWQARVYLEQQDFSKAVVFFDDYIKSGDDRLISDAYLYRAMCYDNMGNTADAAFSLELLLQREDFNDDGYISALLCSLYLKQSKYQTIIDFFDETSPDNFDSQWQGRLRLYRAESYYMLGDMDNAQRLYTELIGVEGAEPAWQRLFTIYRKAGRNDELVSLLNEAEKTLNDKPLILQDFRMRIGIASYNAGDIKTAQTYLLKAWDTSDPSALNGLVPLYLSRILEDAANTDRAIEILEIFLTSSDSHRMEILVRLAGLYTSEEEWGRAESLLDEFFRDYSESALFSDAAYLKAFICYKTNRIENASEYVSRAYSADEKGERTAALLRLDSTLLKKTGKYSRAAETLQRYIDLRPDELSARLDLLRIRFQMKDYNTLLNEAVELKWNDSVRSGNEYVYVLSSYLSGLAATAEGDYQRALNELALISPVNSESAGVPEIYTYSEYYRGWALYRLARYPEAVKAFDELTRDYPDSDSAADAAYIAGWSSYLMGDYDASSGFFLRYTTLSGDSTKGRFMYAKNLASLGRYREASTIFAEIANSDGAGMLADDALFEKAALAAIGNDTEQAAKDYLTLYQKYGGQLAEEGMYRRGEIYYAAGSFKKAVDAFYDFRRSYPESRMMDAALYWGGMSSMKNDESFGAVLLWEKLINDYTESGFRSSAMMKTAEVFTSSGDYSSALDMYERCRLEYPGTDRASESSAMSEKIRFLLDGLSDREAELNVIITREGGADTAEGREAMIELAALHISRGGGDMKPVISMLNQVKEMKAEDPVSAALANYYLGDYYFRQNRPAEAAAAFTEAAGTNPEDLDFSARSLYRAAEAALLAGSRSDAQALVRQLKLHYEESEWADEADKLLGGN